MTYYISTCIDGCISSVRCEKKCINIEAAKAYDLVYSLLGTADEKKKVIVKNSLISSRNLDFSEALKHADLRRI